MNCAFQWSTGCWFPQWRISKKKTNGCCWIQKNISNIFNSKWKTTKPLVLAHLQSSSTRENPEHSSHQTPTCSGDSPAPEYIRVGYRNDVDAGTLVRIRQLYLYLPPSLSQRDVMTVLQEYGRRSCGEADCIRVNIIQVQQSIAASSDLLRPQLYFCIEAFRTKQAMEAHEYLSHTMELRKFIQQYCQKPENDQEVETLIDGQSPFPFRNSWNMKKSYAPLRTPDPRDPWKQRKRALDLLAKDVGIQNVSIRITRLQPTNRASDMECLRKNVFKMARSHCTKDGVIRLDVIEEEKYSGDIFIVEAYQSDDLTKLGYLEFEWEERMQSDVLPFTKNHTVWKGCNVFPDAEEWQVTMPDTLQEAKSTPMNVYQKMAFVFGVGALEKVATYAKRFGKRILIITGWNQARLDPLLWELDSELIQGNVQILPPISVPGMLSSSTFEDLVQNVRIRKPEVIIGMGGGSALDAAKAVAMFAHPENRTLHSFLQHLRDAAQNKKLTMEFFCEEPVLPLILIPSRPTLGAEVTHGSLFSFPGIVHACFVHFTSDEYNWMSNASSNKASAATQNMVSLVDGRLYVRGHHVVIPTAAIASLVLCVESFLSKESNPFTIALAKEGISTVASYVEKASIEPTNMVVAEKVALASVIAGLVREGKNFGLTGAIVLALSGQSAISFRDLVVHVASVTLPNYVAFIKQRGQEDIRQRLRQVSKMITMSDAATEDDLVTWFKQLVHSANLPRWKEAELQHVPWKQVAEMIVCETNRVELPVEMTVDDVNRILEELANK